MTASAQMPKYKCHKEVWALKIADVRVYNDINGKHYALYPEDKSYAAFFVDKEWFRKHNPENGGYYVVYEDGYKSFSPAEAFESGYSIMK